MTPTRSCVVVIGGGSVRRPDADFDVVIAVDSGLDVAIAAGITPTLLVGDLDSISADGVAWAADHGIDIEQHKPDKDDTDTALALRSAVSMGCTDVTVLGAEATDRFDHLLGTLVALGDPLLAAMNSVTAWLGSVSVHVVHPGRTLQLEVADRTTFSLLALHGQCAGVTVAGARWPLDNADLDPGATLGVSNQSIGVAVVISVHSGPLTVIVPGAARDAS